MMQLSFDDLAVGVEETTRPNQVESDGAMPSHRSITDDPYSEFENWRDPEQLALLEAPVINAPLEYLHPDAIRVEPTHSGTMVNYQAALSRAVWKPRFRNLAYLVKHHDTIVALICLSSPVINRLAPRDDYLGLSRDDEVRGKELREYAELSVCVGVQPLAWYWNIGKLAALLACTLGDHWEHAYGDQMKGITTTSLWGKGSQYNRIYKHLGYTKGNGTVHIPEHVFRAMRHRLTREDNLPDFGPSNTNVRPKIVSAYKKHYGLNFSAFHGEIRAVYYHQAIAPELQSTVVDDWHKRWGLPRYERKRLEDPPYTSGK